VASGDPSPDGFVIWTRIAPEPMALDGLGGATGVWPLRWEVAEDEAMRRVVARGVTEAGPALGYSVHVEVAGLKPNRPYWYRFTTTGAQSPVGRARTLPAPGEQLGRLRMTMASCAHYEVGYFSAYRHMAHEPSDYTLFLGDYIYEYSYNPQRRLDLVRSHDAADEASDLAAYRRRYARYRTDPDLQALHAAASCLVTWDDHEVQNDYGGDLSQIAQTAPEAFHLRRAAAYQAFYENMPVRRRAPDDWSRFRVHKRFAFGGLAEISMLDTRQFRSEAACLPAGSRRARVIDPSCPERLETGRTMLGEAQERWLYDGFRQATGRWNLIGQSLLAASVKQRGADNVLGHWSDGWDGYPANRDRMLEAIRASRLSNPLILSGDIHSFWANEVKASAADPESASVAAEFVTTSITADGPPAQPFVGVRDTNPHVRYFAAEHRGYAMLDLTPERLEVRFQGVSDRRDPNAGVSTVARFAVEAGSPRIAST
jgi:alkaline phosphatase D